MVYALITDVPRTGEWAAECVGCEWLDGATEAAIGARFRGHNRLGDSEWSMVAVIDELEADRVFAFHTEDEAGASVTQWRFTLRADGVGTALTESFVRLADPGEKHRAFEKDLFGGRVNRNLSNINASLDRLATIVETPASDR